ncbi:NAD(P)/FAD-dependent oxidoreductase [Ectothiorhodospiraceae bacterium WFHF3C12]|nr:NAD(P)/FAD-dependent oxidoreductase [Ectothiorhodospiraceae bacterium WFHF3C12]
MSNPTPSHHQIVIVGGGTAGTTVAASLLRRRPNLDVAIIEPSDTHYYQPAFTLVGGGTYAMERTVRPQRETLPDAATWIRQRVATFEPDQDQVTLEDGCTIGYQVLVVAPGIHLDWDRVEGLREALGRNGVCSNYHPELAPYTWKCLRGFRGGNAVFTQPPPPLKCAGAPQKIAYLAADHQRRQGRLSQSNLGFYSGAGALFSVPDFVPHLERVAQRYSIDVKLGHDLVSVDSEARVARFKTTDGQGETRIVEQPFEMLHVTPHQRAPDFLRDSPLANADGWADVDAATTQHQRYPNVFSLGDASSLPTSKTAAAVRKQAPVSVQNLLAWLDNKPMAGRYDGYTSCPLVTAYGRVMLAEFVYNGVVTPTLPLDPFKESRFYWFVKKRLLPPFYWKQMLRGREPDIRHRPLKSTNG